MGSKAPGDSTGDVVVPRLPYLAIPPKIARAFPDLAQWNKENNEALEKWREQVNAGIAKSITSVKTTP